MPPLKEFVFESVLGNHTVITISTYGDEKKAIKKLSFYVKDINDFKLKN